MTDTTANRFRNAWALVPALSRFAGALMAGSSLVLVAAMLGMGVGDMPYVVGLLHLGTMVALFWLMILMAKHRIESYRRKRRAVLTPPHWWLLGVLVGSGVTIATQMGPMMRLGPHEIVCEEGTCILEQEGRPVRYLTPVEVHGFDASMLLVFSAGWLFLNTVAVLTDHVVGLSGGNRPSHHSGRAR